MEKNEYGQYLRLLVEEERGPNALR
jgi:hypothetical protein